MTAALVAVATGLTGVVAGLLPYPSVSVSRADEPTISVDNARDGWDSAETTGSLTPSSLLSGSFGQLFSAPVNGQVYAQPLVAGGTLIVATENDWVYGLDPTSGAVRWSRSVGTPWPASAVGCPDLAPNVGITSTPVFDPAGPNGPTVYLIAKVIPAGSTAANPVYELHAVNPATGTDYPGWPVRIKGTPVNDPADPFNSFTEAQRPGLLLLGGSVYAGFASYCDYQPYVGVVAGVSTSTGAVTMWTDEAGLTSKMAGIWQSGGGLMSDGAGRIFTITGNGVSPVAGAGTKPPGQLAESVVRLGVQPDGSLAAQDFFSPVNAPALDAADLDFGSGGPVALPFNTAALPHLMLAGGKDGRVFVLNRDSLGGRGQGSGGTDGVVSTAGPFLGEWGHPAAYADQPALTAANAGTSRDYVYYVSKKGALLWLRAGLGGTGGTTPILTSVANSSGAFGYLSGSPVVTSAGTGPAADSSAVVWAVNDGDPTGAAGALLAYPAVPTGTCTKAAPCSVAPLWQFPLTGVGKYTTPATDGGRVYIGTRGAAASAANCPGLTAGTICGRVMGFGSPVTAPVGGASPVSFGPVPVGTVSVATSVTVARPNLAAGTVSVSQPTAAGAGFAVAGPFYYTPSGGARVAVAAWPQVMGPGDSLEADGVTFTPSVPGGASGSVQFPTSSVNFPVVSAGLAGSGTAAGFYPNSAAVAFGTSVDPIPVGTSQPVALNVTNYSTGSETISASDLSAPFRISGLPAPTTVIAPGQSVPVTLTYSPTVAGPNDTATLTLTGTDTVSSVATSTTVALTGYNAAATVPTLTPSVTGLSFGSVPLGRQQTQVLTVTNTGNLPATITGTALPSVPFGAPVPVTAGLVLNPGDDVQIPVTFGPASLGAFADAYSLNWTDVAGSHRLAVPLSGTGAAPATGTIAVPPPGGGWTFNGSARMVGRNLSLTPVAVGKAGSAIYSQVVPSDGLKASFTVQLGGGTGAEGMTFSLLDPATTGVGAVGATGPRLGFGGLGGVAVTLDTYKDGAGYPSANFVGIATGSSGNLLTFAATSTAVPALRTGTHVVGVSVTGGTITVTVDGKQALSKAVTIPPNVRVAFTGSTGGKTDQHLVTASSITAGGNVIPRPGGGWSYNGSAGTGGSATILTINGAKQTGTVIYPFAVKSAGLKVTFNAVLSSSATTGGEGLAFGLLNPAKATAASVGGGGAQLGLGGLPGVYVLAGTDHTVAGWPKTDLLAISAAGNGTVLVPQSYARGIAPLRTASHTITVTVVNGGTGVGLVVTVWMDGYKEAAYAEPALTPTVLLAFSGATATLTDLHVARYVSITANK